METWRGKLDFSYDVVKLSFYEMILFFILLFLLILIILPKSLKKKKKYSKRKSQYPIRFNDWMELTKKERQDLDLSNKKETMEKKKALLKSIREDYSRLKNKL